MTLAHIVYLDKELRVKQVIDAEHTAIRVEFGKFTERDQPSVFDEFVGCTIRDDYQ